MVTNPPQEHGAENWQNGASQHAPMCVQHSNNPDIQNTLAYLRKEGPHSAHTGSFRTYGSVTMATSHMHPVGPINPVIRTM